MNRIASLALAALALPMALAAQQPSPTTDPITGTYKAAGTRYGNWLVSAFDSIPASRYGYKPTPVQQSVGYIAQHLESANYALCAQFGSAPRMMTARDSLADTIKAAWPKDTLVARLRASFAYCDAAMATVNDSRLAETVMAGPPGNQRPYPRARFLLSFVTDLVDHYSQVAVYMRLNGMIPPSSQPRPRS